jgi:hypothetical protein
MKTLILSIWILLYNALVPVAQPNILSPSAIYREVVKSTVTIITDAENWGSDFVDILYILIRYK